MGTQTNYIIYLDNCCFNRPYDEQNQESIKLETEAKLHVQNLIKQNLIDLAWSFILDYENEINPFIDRRESIAEWKTLAKRNISSHEDMLLQAIDIQKKTNLKANDSLHIACAQNAGAQYLLTTDKQMLKVKNLAIQIINPVDFVFILEEGVKK